MGSERWQQVTEIFHAALASDPARREAFLADACGGDAVLRAEVEALVAAHHEAGPFGETPLFVPALSLEPGSSIGSYRIEELLGAGGMGEVYRARDGTLERDVAIKVLPQHFASDSERVARLLREARLLAALNHPNIAAIYGVVEADAHRGLVLEFVEGPTLAERRSGGIPLPEALSIARQIADALDAAHGKGIIHRDLKPANIKAAPGGIVKVLDFGLAKIDAVDDGGSADLSHSPTVTVGSTRAGVILGTAAYMSPEQARGKAVDKRTDIWSFGCVLYEMLTGRTAFCGETVSDTIASILSREPDWAAVPDDNAPGRAADAPAVPRTGSTAASARHRRRQAGTRPCPCRFASANRGESGSRHAGASSAGRATLVVCGDRSGADCSGQRRRGVLRSSADDAPDRRSRSRRSS